MDIVTFEALQKSITKWEKKRDTRDLKLVSVSDSECPLCDLYYRYGCDGCPVESESGYPYCRNTPYRAVSNFRQEFIYDDLTDDQFHTWSILCQKEIDFLKSLLPQE